MWDRAAEARLRLARESWSNGPAACSSGATRALSGAALRDCDPAALSRLLRQSFAELREPAAALRVQGGAGRRSDVAAAGGGLPGAGAGALALAAQQLEPRKRKPRGRNAAMARLREQEK